MASLFSKENNVLPKIRLITLRHCTYNQQLFPYREPDNVQ